MGGPAGCEGVEAAVGEFRFNAGIVFALSN